MAAVQAAIGTDPGHPSLQHVVRETNLTQVTRGSSHTVTPWDHNLNFKETHSLRIFLLSSFWLATDMMSRASSEEGRGMEGGEEWEGEGEGGRGREGEGGREWREGG